MSLEDDPLLPELFESTSPKRTQIDGADPAVKWPTRGSTEGYVRPSHRLARRKQKDKPYHASLQASLDGRFASTELGTIPKTVGLQGDRAEEVYRASRPVHTSPVTAAPLQPPRNERDADEKQICHFSPPCKLMHHEEHRRKFMHECKHGVLCTRRGDPSHTALYFHTNTEPEDRWAGKTGWEAENGRSPYCMPSIKASVYQKAPPASSSVPRAGWRPQGGVPPSEAEVLGAARKPPRKDEVSLLLSGIDFTWTDERLMDFLREHAGKALIVEAKLVHEAGETRNSGKALVSVQCYADAQALRKAVHNRHGKTTENALDLSYRDAIAKEIDRAAQASRETRGRDPAVSRFNRAIKRCGPYYEDAEALFERMREEGHKPDAQSFVALLSSYRDAQPAQASKAEATLAQMRSVGLLPNSAVCNLVVDCWCRAGNMPKAERLVAEMEKGGASKKSVFAAALPEKDETYLAIPNEETYQVLIDGWERLGLMEEMAERQRGFRMDEDTDAKELWSIGGVVGIRPPANSHLTSLARRRAGYTSMHTGQMMQKNQEDNLSLYTLEKWRSRT